MRATNHNRVRLTVMSVALGLMLTQHAGDQATQEETLSVIVQGSDTGAISLAVQRVGGDVTHELAIIDAIGAELTKSQIHALKSTGLIKRIYPDAQARAAQVELEPIHKNDKHARDTFYPTMIEADALHMEGLDATGVTVAVVDTGLWDESPWLKNDMFNQERFMVRYDAIADAIVSNLHDRSGHGTHVTSVMLSGRRSLDETDDFTGAYNGIAPGADIVAVRAFDENGMGTYRDVIRGIEFVVENKDVYNIRVLNLSFSATPQSHYWDDPLNQAVMRAWKAGIVVVASAGNNGPDPMTIGVPGNVPYIITVGAMTDNFTPKDPTDDMLAKFSAAGPTAEGFVKPDLVAPGGHMLGLMKKDSELAKNHPEFHDGGSFFVMSGTSQAAAVVSGAAAILLQSDPTLTPDEVKARLMRTARPAARHDGTLAYSVFQQGAGLVNIYDAVYADLDTEHANSSLNVDYDLEA